MKIARIAIVVRNSWPSPPKSGKGARAEDAGALMDRAPIWGWVPPSGAPASWRRTSLPGTRSIPSRVSSRRHLKPPPIMDVGSRGGLGLTGKSVALPIAALGHRGKPPELPVDRPQRLRVVDQPSDGATHRSH